jgi:hypothetical protein
MNSAGSRIAVRTDERRVGRYLRVGGSLRKEAESERGESTGEERGKREIKTREGKHRAFLVRGHSRRQTKKKQERGVV